MYDDDRDALAAEYVLGTLSAEERAQAEALLAIDHGFAETVRVWEHRLGELNVMVEAVEPPAEVWQRIKNDIDGAARHSSADATLKPADDIDSLELEGSPPTLAVADEQSASESFAENLTATEEAEPGRTGESGHDDTVAALASSLLPPEAAAEFDKRPTRSAAEIAQTSSGDKVARTDGSVRYWRRLGIGASIIAAVLAAYIAAAQFVPGLTVGRQSQPVAVAPKHPAQLMAVLQQEPTAPAFLLTLDPVERTITARRLTTAPDSGRSYELWLYSPKLSKPVSLGLVGSAEVTNRPVPANLDVETMRAANFSVSLEGTNGSSTGTPSGPILFKGQMIEASPAGPG
jgi:anti-sigma-K factor RskA